MAHILSDHINQMRTILEKSQEIVIILGAKPTIDSMAASLSLYLALSSVGKHVNIVCNQAPTVELNRLVGIDKVGSSFTNGNGRNLIISFPYQEGSIEKVSYNIENDTFNLVIEPRDGYPSITPEMMKYTLGGGNIDVIITVGSISLEDLGGIYQNNQGVFSEKPLINIDMHRENTQYGKVNIVDNSVSSICELLISVLSQIGFNLDSDMATNLLTGIISSTENFTSQTTNAETFEAAALCLKAGAQKPVSQPYNATPLSTSSFPLPNMTKPPISPIQTNKPNNVDKHYMTPQKPLIHPTPIRQIQKPQNKQHQSDAPPDWLKPKIYKGSTLL